MNNKTLLAWFNEHKNKLGLFLLIVLVAGFWFATDSRVSDVEQDLEAMYSPLKPYLPEEAQAKIDELIAKWDEIEPTVMDFEDWLEEQGESTAVTYSYQTLIHGDGPDKLVCESGGEIEVKSGGLFDLQTGATATMAGTIDFSGATVTNLAMSGGTINGNLVVTGTSDLYGNVSSSQGGVTITDAFIVTSTADFQDDIADSVGDLTVADNFVITGTLDVQGGAITLENDESVANSVDGTIALNGNVDVTGTLQYGADDLYPLGYASASQQVECGVTSTFTDTTAVTASALTTATYVIAIQITDPITTASILTVDAPAANVFNIDSWESDFTVGTTGITVYWCAIGNQ